MKKALLVGINDYLKFSHLSCCLNDVACLKTLLENNDDKSTNFSVKTLLNEEATIAGMKRELRSLFDGNAETVLFYFSGHGADDSKDGTIAAYDGCKDDVGVDMTKIMQFAYQSTSQNIIIILDCCHAGYAGDFGLIGDSSILKPGMVILTASKKNQTAVEINGHGIFTDLLLQALSGGASDLLGRVTPGSLYTFIDNALGPWNQRPLFKANVSSLIVLRKCLPKVSANEINQLTSLFLEPTGLFQLDPSFEPTNFKGSKHYHKKPFYIESNGEIFSLLQKFNRNGLVVPHNCKHMYDAAMESKSCKLTNLGQYYWMLVSKKYLPE